MTVVLKTNCCNIQCYNAVYKCVCAFVFACNAFRFSIHFFHSSNSQKDIFPSWFAHIECIHSFRHLTPFLIFDLFFCYKLMSLIVSVGDWLSFDIHDHMASSFYSRVLFVYEKNRNGWLCLFEASYSETP